MFKNVFVIGVIYLLAVSCAGRQAATASVAVTDNTDSETGAAASPTESGEVQIVENRQVIVLVEAKLAAKYRERNIPEPLAGLLVKAHVDFNIPEQFKMVEPVDNPIWDYDCALAADSGKVEIRFKVVSAADEKLPENGSDIPDDPDRAAKSISTELMGILMRLNGATLIADMQQHPLIEAKTRFNAQNYSTATFEPLKEFAPYEIGSAGIFYKEGVGKVIVVSLINGLNDPQARTEWVTGANAMRFADEAE